MRTLLHASCVALLLSCTATSPPPCVPVTPTAPPARANPLEGEVATPRMTYVFRAAPFANFVYQLDCLAGLTACSRDAYEALWKRTLGIDDADRTALDTWRRIHERTYATIRRYHEPADPPLPLWRRSMGLARRLRLAAYDAAGEEDALSRFRLFLDPEQANEAAEVLARFRPRFDKFWAQHRDELAQEVQGFVRVASRPDVQSLLERIATFYGPQLGPHERETIELIARPPHASADHGEQLANHALVEVILGAPASPGMSGDSSKPPGEHPQPGGETPESRLGVVLHEVFHTWLAASPEDQQRELVGRFADDLSPMAIPAYGLFDEALATSFGNGLVARLMNAPDFERRKTQKLGLYGDRFIDAAAKALLPNLESELSAAGGVFAPDFTKAYIAAIEAAFPHGIGPAAYLRPTVCVNDPALSAAADHLSDVMGSPLTESADDFEGAGPGLIRKHSHWGAVLAITANGVDALGAMPDIVDKAALLRIRKEAATPPFVYTILRDRAAPVFVLVANDDLQMQGLVDRFAALDALVVGVWRPG